MSNIARLLLTGTSTLALVAAAASIAGAETVRVNGSYVVTSDIVGTDATPPQSAFGILMSGDGSSVDVQAGTVKGGRGGDALNKNGGSSHGINASGTNSTVTIRSGATVVGGVGGAGRNGGNGGQSYGVTFTSAGGRLTNDGTIKAGTEGAGGYAAGIYTGAQTAIVNNGVVSGEETGGGAIFNGGPVSLTNNGLITSKGVEDTIIVTPSGQSVEIINYGTIANTHANAARNVDYNAVFTMGTGARLVNYGRIVGNIGVYGGDAELIFDGSRGGGRIEGAIHADSDDPASAAGRVLFRNGETTLTGVTDHFEENGVNFVFPMLIGMSENVRIEQGATLILAGSGDIHTKKGFVNDGVLNLGRNRATIGGGAQISADNKIYTVQGGAISGSGSIVTYVGSGTHGYIVTDGNTASDLSKMTVVPVVEGDGVKNGSKYVVVQNYGGTNAAPAVAKAGGFIWSADAVAAAGQTDTDGLSYGSSNRAVVISASLNELVASAAGVNGSSVKALAGYLGADPGLKALSLAVNNLTSEAEIAKAGAQLRPDAAGAASKAAQGAVNQAVNTIQARTDSFRANAAMRGQSGVSTGDEASGLAFWGQVFGGVAEQGRRNGLDGYESSTRGLAFGADTAATDDLRVGLSLAYARTDVDDSGARSGSGQEVNSYIVGLYASYNAPSWYVDGALTYGHHKYDSVRLVNFTGVAAQTAQASYDGRQYGARAEAGVPLALGGAVVTPFAALAFNHLKQDGYTETGTAGAALSVNGSSSNSLRSGLGVKASADFAAADGWTLTPNARAVWLHEFNGDAPNLTSRYVAGGSAFTTAGAESARDHAVLGVGLDLASSGGTTLSAKYDADLSEQFVGHSGLLQLRALF